MDVESPALVHARSSPVSISNQPKSSRCWLKTTRRGPDWSASSTEPESGF